MSKDDLFLSLERTPEYQSLLRACHSHITFRESVHGSYDYLVKSLATFRDAFRHCVRYPVDPAARQGLLRAYRSHLQLILLLISQVDLTSIRDSDTPPT